MDRVVTPSMSSSLDEKVRALRSALAYDERSRTVEAVETHFAWVFFTDAHAYKLKKPVRTEYQDLRSLEARRFGCAEEVRLNRRLAADVYLGLMPLARRPDGSLHVGDAGAVVDWLVKMRRLPFALMLDQAMAAGTASQASLQAVGELLADFYRTQRRIPFEPRKYVARMQEQIREDQAALRNPELQLNPALVEAVAQKSMSACERLRDELAARAAQRRIVEAHGDLRPEHICLSSPPRIIDCLEFSEDLRTLDPGEELAFLSVECAQAGHPRVGDSILTAYCARSADPIGAALLDFYRSRRATVRAKLVAWHVRDPQYRDLAAWSANAEEYLVRATDYARRACEAAS